MQWFITKQRNNSQHTRISKSEFKSATLVQTVNSAITKNMDSHLRYKAGM